MFNIQIDKEVLLHEIEDVEYELYKKTIYIDDYIELALQQLTPKHNCEELLQYYVDGLIYCILVSIRHYKQPLYMADKIDDFFTKIKSLLNKSNKNVFKIADTIFDIYSELHSF